MEWLGEWFKRQLPLEILPGVTLVNWREVHGAPGNLFTVETLRIVCTWFGN